MNKFINTVYKDTIDSLVDGFKNKLDNTHYANTDKRPVALTYLNQNKIESTLDQGSNLSYTGLGDQSPARYNKIKGAFLYGLEKVIVNLDNGEFGLESDSMEGEAITLPNSFEPIPEDYFYINHLNKNILFKVTSVTPDTLDNGANIYKIGYKLDQYDYDEAKLDKQVVEVFNMIVNNIGTQYKTVIRSADYDFISDTEDIVSKLKDYYQSLFFNSKVQTFTFLYNNSHFYDPYLIEFLIKNKILEGGDSYVYVSHAIFVPHSFVLDYDRTFFRSIELNNKKKLNIKNAYGILIKDPNSLLSTRLEDYFKIDYSPTMFADPITPIETELVDRILNNVLYENDSDKLHFNIIIKYFNNTDFESDIITLLDNMEFESNIVLFYHLPIIIFILETVIKKLLLKD